MLSPEQFAELIALIQTTHDDGPKPEVRRAQRIAHPCRITITLGTLHDSGPSIPVQMKDISARGMCLLHHTEMPPGTQFVINLTAPNGRNVSILTNVVHCRQLDEHSYQIGAEFACPVHPPDDIKIEPAPEDLMRIRSSILR